jgi:hypothetical protein
MPELVLLIVVIALGVGMYSVLAGSSFARPFIVLAVLGAGSYSIFTSLHAPKFAPRIDKNGIHEGAVNSASPLARKADTATKGEDIAPRNEAGPLTKGQKLEAAAGLQNVPAIQNPREPTQASSSDLGSVVFDFPASGCPKKLPTYKTVTSICTPLDREACDRNQLCAWLKGLSEYGSANCAPKWGSYLSPPPIDPSDSARLGIGAVDAEAMVASAAPYLAKGDDYAAHGKFRKAITEYTRALKESRGLASALAGRASVYERIGDKAHAVRDYCEAVANSGHFETYKRAKARIAQLTGQPAAASPSPSAVNQPASLPSDLRPTKSPPTSTIERSRRRNAIAPFAVETESGTYYLIKLVRVDGMDSILIFVRGGETYSTKVPLGSYNIRAAAGSIWYGRKDFFGPSTHFFRMRNKDGKNPTFNFYRQGNKVFGMTVSLMKVIEGNMEEETISRDEF